VTPTPLNPDEFRALGHQVVDWIAEYLRKLETLPVQPHVQPGDLLARLPESAPQQGLFAEGWPAIFRDLDELIIPGLMHWQAPGFFGYFPCNASTPGILGEFLSAGLNINGMLWSTSPAATELETRVMDWLARMLDLPTAFLSSSGSGGGAIQGTASESTLIALLAARARARRAGLDDTRLTLYASEHAHSSVIKAAMIAGLADHPEDRRRLRLIGADQHFALRPDLLAEALRTDIVAGLAPFYVCATVGTTSTTAIDPLVPIGAAIEACGLAGRTWLHVDAAHAGAACICPEFCWMLAGSEHADSICFNPHKWMLTNFDCDCFWMRDRAAIVEALSIAPEYLRNRATESGQVIDYRDWQIPLGRRFRALKLWLVIRHYGIAGLQAYIREHIRLATLFEELVRADQRFEVVAPRVVNLVCFRLRGDETDDLNRLLMQRLNETGRIFLTHTVLPLGGNARFVLRMAIGASTTRECHIRAAWDLIQTAAGELIRKGPSAR
jgi:aromatic-L-amino-acid/L-tryptophan decarboxylase